jgi:hypothetical protein
MRYLRFCLLLLPLTLWAQTPIPPEVRNSLPPQTKEKTSSPEDKDKRPAPNTADQNAPDPSSQPPPPSSKKVFDKKFVTLMIGIQTSTALDLESSFYALKNCPPNYRCRESNPLLRPFVRSGRPAAYALTTGTNALAIWSSYRMRKKGSRFWWVPLTVSIGIHSAAALKNYHLVQTLPASPPR